MPEGINGNLTAIALEPTDVVHGHHGHLEITHGRAFGSGVNHPDDGARMSSFFFGLLI
jgi:hypothetical protein